MFLPHSLLSLIGKFRLRRQKSSGKYRNRGKNICLTTHTTECFLGICLMYKMVSYSHTRNLCLSESQIDLDRAVRSSNEAEGHLLPTTCIGDGCGWLLQARAIGNRWGIKEREWEIENKTNRRRKRKREEKEKRRNTGWREERRKETQRKRWERKEGEAKESSILWFCLLITLIFWKVLSFFGSIVSSPILWPGEADNHSSPNSCH